MVHFCFPSQSNISVLNPRFSHLIFEMDVVILFHREFFYLYFEINPETGSWLGGFGGAREWFVIPQLCVCACDGKKHRSCGSFVPRIKMSKPLVVYTWIIYLYELKLTSILYELLWIFSVCDSLLFATGFFLVFWTSIVGDFKMIPCHFLT